jgi:hypothetical protein
MHKEAGFFWGEANQMCILEFGPVVRFDIHLDPLLVLLAIDFFEPVEDGDECGVRIPLERLAGADLDESVVGRGEVALDGSRGKLVRGELLDRRAVNEEKRPFRSCCRSVFWRALFFFFFL